MNDKILSVGKLSDYPPQLWGPKDWQRLAETENARPLDDTQFVVLPTAYLPDGFTLHERPRGPRAADAVLKKFGLR